MREGGSAERRLQTEKSREKSAVIREQKAESRVQRAESSKQSEKCRE